jgi:hypothetical protein
MNPNQIAQKLSTKSSGQFFSVISRRPAKTRKDCPFVIEKVSQYQGQLTEYSRRKTVREGVESGERDAPSLPRGVKESFYIGRAKFFRYFNGNEALAINVEGNRPSSQFFIDGKPVEESQVAEYLLSSELSPPKNKEQLAEKSQAPFVVISCQNVIDIK